MEPISDEEYYRSCNKVAMHLAEMGIDLSPLMNDTADKIIALSEVNVEVETLVNPDYDISKILFDTVFEAQLHTYLDSVKYGMNIINNAYSSLDCNANLLSYEDALNLLQTHSTSLELFTDACSALSDVILEDLLELSRIEFENIFGSYIREVCDTYISTSFFVGLTDCRALSYVVMTSPEVGTHHQVAKELLSACFPKLIQ